LCGPLGLRADSPDATGVSANPEARAAFLARDVKEETLRAWTAYTTYAWPHDELLPLSKRYSDRYGASISIAPIDAYSTLKVMGLTSEAKRIEAFVVNDFTSDKDDDVKVFEVNIRILEGLLCMYEMSGDARILEKARGFGDRLLPAFRSPTGLPYYYVNLKTGATRGNVVCVAEAGSYLLEFGILSYYTGNPVYIKEHCRTEVVYCHIEDVRTMKQADEMETFFIAETLKYCYLTFDKGNPVNPDDYAFSTEAHPFRKGAFHRPKVILNLGHR
jgi:hypothetical protein